MKRSWFWLLLLVLIAGWACGTEEEGDSGEPLYTHPEDEILVLPGEKAFPESLFVKSANMEDLTLILSLYHKNEGEPRLGFSQDYADVTGDGTVDTLVHELLMQGDSLRYRLDLRTERGSILKTPASYPDQALIRKHWKSPKVYNQTYPWSSIYYTPEVKARTAVPDTTPPYIRRYKTTMQMAAKADSLSPPKAEQAVNRFLSYMESFKGRHLLVWEGNTLRELVWYAPESYFIPLVPAKK